MTNKHTPGPWNISLDDDLWPMVMGDGKIVANVNRESFYGGVADLVEMPADANARLVAAAPELLAALKALLERHQIDDPHHAHMCEFCKQADLAIAKAEGR